MNYEKVLFIGGSKNGRWMTVLACPKVEVPKPGARETYEARRFVTTRGMRTIFVLDSYSDEDAFEALLSVR